MVIKSNTEYQQFIKDILHQAVFVDYISGDYDKHPAYRGNIESSKPYIKVIGIFIKNISTNVTYSINFGHQDVHKFNISYQDVIKDVMKVTKNVFVIDKKRFIHIFGSQDVDDILLFKFQFGAIEHDNDDFNTNYHDYARMKIGAINELNYIIPFSKHLEVFENKYDYYKNEMLKFKSSNSYKMMNGVITETLFELEKNGMWINKEEYNKHFQDKPTDDIVVYTEYNLFTSTGRPSNHFGGINYAALNKDNGCRKSFTSRFHENGMLITMDFSAYHPRIIANLVKYPIGLDVNIYEFLGKQLFNTDIINEELLKKAKQLTFLNLYGGVRDEHLHIPYFQKVNEYKKHRWEFFNENGYVETPIFKRKITKNHITDANQNKLFNYILQGVEMEFSVPTIKRVNDYLKDKKSKVVLYTYDSILIDACKDDKKDFLLDIKSIMVDNQFPVKCYAGNNYQDMTFIQL